MTIFIFFTLLHSNMSYFKWFLTTINFALILSVAAGISAKLSAFILVLILSIENVSMNNFWSVPEWMSDYVRYDFFLTLSVIGGLLFIVSHGAGDISVDKAKKAF
jgi:uncharacterized membrane protein YphA (DoxX/SURF4 family)